MLHRLNALPDGFLTASARELHEVLPGPTLIHLPGRRHPELFVAVLQHGNEDVGLVAIQQVLKNLHADEGHPLPRAMSIYVGNVQAAKHGLRRLDHQPDFNRVWPGTHEHIGTAEHAMCAQVRDIMAQRGLFASIDVHNNTGLNPHYSVVSGLDPHTLHLALLFSRTVVWYRGTYGSMTGAFADLCPALAVECGKPGQAANEEAAARFIDACLHLTAFPEQPVQEGDVDLYHTMAVVHVAPDVDFGFGEPLAALNFDPRLDHLNFVDLPVGAVFGHTHLAAPLQAHNEAGEDVGATYFRTVDGRLTLQRAAMPSMLTLDARVIRQDCLCYLMERVPFEFVVAARGAPAGAA